MSELAVCQVGPVIGVGQPDDFCGNLDAPGKESGLALEWRIDPGRTGTREIRIYDMTGRAILSVTEGLQDLTSARVTLPVADFGSGIYFAVPFYGNMQADEGSKFAVVR